MTQMPVRVTSQDPISAVLARIGSRPSRVLTCSEIYNQPVVIRWMSALVAAAVAVGAVLWFAPHFRPGAVVRQPCQSPSWLPWPYFRETSAAASAGS